MKAQLTEPKQLDYQKKIEQSGKLLLAIINNVLDMARIESGKMKVDENYEIVGEVVDEIISTFASEAEERGIHLSGSMQVTHRNILCDGTKIREIYVNLVSNAIKYMDKPKGIIQIRIKDVGDFIQVEIEDNGKGIAAKDIVYIFDRFYRTDVSRNSSKGGSGIGLSIVKKILEDHGGKVWATSRLGIGTIMYFVLRKYQEVPMK